MTKPVRYGEHSRFEPGTPCSLCGALPLQPLADHCHEHGWVRGAVCHRCNALMAGIDRRVFPRESAITPPVTVAALVAFAAQCPDCDRFAVEDLVVATSVRELRDTIGYRVDAAYFAGETTVITKNGEPRAVLVPHDVYIRLVKDRAD